MKKKIRFEIERSKHNEFYIQIITKNGKETFRSSETYKRKASARKTLDRFILAINNHDYEIIDNTVNPITALEGALAKFKNSSSLRLPK